MNKQSSHKKNYTNSLIALFPAVLTLSSVSAQQEPGKDTTAVPAIAERLNLKKKNFPRRQKDKQPDGDWDICSPPPTARRHLKSSIKTCRKIAMPQKPSRVSMALRDNH